jgi:hypothetical protein
LQQLHKTYFLQFSFKTWRWQIFYSQNCLHWWDDVPFIRKF